MWKFLVKMANTLKTSEPILINRNLCAATTKLPLCNRLQGKIAVITASTEGIGFSIARRLASEGAKVVVSSRKEANVCRAVNKLKEEGYTLVTGVKCHVSKEEDRHKLFDHAYNTLGGIDIFISNAAVNPEVGPVLDTSESAWDKIFEVNVKSSFLLAKEVLPFLKMRGGGSITFVSSIAGFQPFSLLGAYSVSKTCLFGLTKAASIDLAPENIRVNCVAPGIVETKFSAAVKLKYHWD